MSQQPINLSPDLQHLRKDGFDIEILSNHLLVKDVPYVNSVRAVKRGVLVSKLTLAGNITAPPDDHVAYFVGEHPCNSDGTAIEKIRHGSNSQTLAEGIIVQHSFSAKPKPNGHYADYHTKMTTYVAILSGPALELDPTATAKTFPVIEPKCDDPNAIFHYIDTASSRAEIGVVTKKLALRRIAIIGIGGTGSYVLDLTAKTPVKEIHLFDGDIFLQHNAFRSPGAASIDELRAKLPKATYFKNLYSKMRRGIIDHPVYVDASNVAELQDMDFVFLCLDNGAAKRIIVESLERFGRPFVDVGMGINMSGDSLGGILRVTTSTAKARDHVRTRISLVDAGDGRNEYDRNIQVADLNALNAALAVMKWKKLFGFYRDLKNEHHSTFTIDGNLLLSEDRLS
jgi:hypothetical protein